MASNACSCRYLPCPRRTKPQMPEFHDSRMHVAGMERNGRDQRLRNRGPAVHGAVPTAGAAVSFCVTLVHGLFAGWFLQGVLRAAAVRGTICTAGLERRLPPSPPPQPRTRAPRTRACPAPSAAARSLALMLEIFECDPSPTGRRDGCTRSSAATALTPSWRRY